MYGLYDISRLYITGTISNNTPICVLTEIADAHGIRYNEKDKENPHFAYCLVEHIYKESAIKLNKLSILEKLQWVARFVNKYHIWPEDKLTDAYNFLTEFMNNEDPLQKIPIDFEGGLQTPESTRSLNACVLYKICMFHRLDVNPNTTVANMTYAVKLLREPGDSLLRRTQFFINKNARRTDLIKILMSTTHQIQDPTPEIKDNEDHDIVPVTGTTYEALQKLYSPLNDIKTLQFSIEPSTHDGSIALAAINYLIDISKANNPVVEYKNLKISGRSDYTPIDCWMKYWYKINPIIFDLSVHFNPLFPEDFYESNRLMMLVSNEGYNNDIITVSSAYELMQVAYVSKTFYVGPCPNMKSKETSISLDNLDDIPYGELLCYGQYSDTLQPISIQELIDLFSNNQNFTDPFSDDSIFSSVALTKLKNILTNVPINQVSNKISSETLQLRSQLLELINSIEFFSKIHDSDTKVLINTYRQSDNYNKRLIIKALTEVLYISMFMRGWMGEDYEYPLQNAPITLEQEPQIALNVTNGILEYETAIKNLGMHVGPIVDNLPLVRYRCGEYQQSTTKTDGITIKERIQIVKEGDSSDTIKSCIRLSSNWLASSAHKYLTAIGQPSPFDIFKLKEIG
jgi:hypothetical protein